MRFLVAALAVLAAAPAARAADVTMVVRDVPMHATRTLAAATPRFDMVALHWQGRGVPLFSVRTLAGRWTPWEAADDDWGRAGAWRKQGSPEWTGEADAIRYRFRGRVTRLRAYFLSSPVSLVPMRRLSLAGSPPIIPRSGWQADESIRRAPPQYAPALQFAIVHHTVNSNNYTPAQSAAIVRGIEVYHVKGNGWNDIGYNFLVDKYGQVFEGRYGGIDQNVVGAHSQGFNTGSVGVAVIGTYDSTGISAAARASLVQLLAWRLDLAHIDPLSTLSFLSGGNSRFPAGVPVFLRAISGHRDTYFTDCPGNALYAQLPAIANAVAAAGLPKLYAPLTTGKIGGPIRFTATLTTALPWSVTVTDATGAVVATGGGTGTAVDWTWDATAARPGLYRWTIDAGAAVLPATGTVGAKPTPLAIRGLKATPPSISPNGDGIADSATIAYALSVPAVVTATLVSSAGQTPTTLFSDQKSAGAQSFAFAVGSDVADGRYTISLQAQSADGQHAAASVAVQVDRTVSDFAAAPSAISPNGDGVKDAASISFTLARPAQATLQVLQRTHVVAKVASGSYPAGTPVTAAWGGPARDGRYTLQLTAGGVVRTLPLLVDTRRPSVRPISWTRLRFRVSEPGAVTLVGAGHRWTKRAKAAGLVTFSLRARPRRYTVVERDAAGNASVTLRRR